MRAPDVVMTCDHPGCLAIPDMAPRIYVPSKTAEEKGHGALTLAFPHLHYCKAHWDTDVRLDPLLTDKVKGRFEDLAKKVRPIDFKCDFDAALIEPLSVYTPEYGRYMQRLGFHIDGLGYSLHQSMQRTR